MFRKHIRGVRRHFRRQRQAATNPAVLNAERLAQHRVDYSQFSISPWFDHQRPLREFRRLWVTRLVTDFHRWRAQLARAYPSFYLAVWLFEPHFGQSQLVAAVADRYAQYDKLFGEEAPFRAVTPLALPSEYRGIPGIQDLEWRRYADIEALLPEDYAARGPATWRKPHWDATTVDGEPYIAVQVGWVWVGRCHPDGALPPPGIGS